MQCIVDLWAKDVMRVFCIWNLHLVKLTLKVTWGPACFNMVCWIINLHECETLRQSWQHNPHNCNWSGMEELHHLAHVCFLNTSVIKFLALLCNVIDSIRRETVLHGKVTYNVTMMWHRNHIILTLATTLELISWKYIGEPLALWGNMKKQNRDIVHEILLCSADFYVLLSGESLIKLLPTRPQNTCVVVLSEARALWHADEEACWGSLGNDMNQWMMSEWRVWVERTAELEEERKKEREKGVHRVRYSALCRGCVQLN